MARSIEAARIFYTLEAETAGLDRQLTGVERSLGRTAAFVKAHPVAALGALAAAAGAVALKAAEMAARFDKSMTEISTLVDTTKVDMDKLADGVLALFASLPVGTIDELTQGLYNVISAGVPASEALDFLRIAAEAAIGGVTDVNTAVNGLTTAVNAFASQGLTATEAADAFFVAVKAGKTTFAEISAGIGQVASLAASLGISLDDLLANMVALTKGGLGTNQAFTALRAVLSNILKPANEFAAQFPKLAGEFDVASLRSKGLTQFMVDLGGALEGNTTAASKMFGSVEGLNAVLGLTANEGASVRDVMDQMANKTGASGEAFRKMAATTENLQQVLKNKLSAAMIDFGRSVLPLVNAGLRVTISLVESATWVLDTLLGRLSEVDKIELNNASTSVHNLTRALQSLPLDRQADAFDRLTQSMRALSQGPGGALRDDFLAINQGLAQTQKIARLSIDDLRRMHAGLVAVAGSGKLTAYQLVNVGRALDHIRVELERRLADQPRQLQEEEANLREHTTRVTRLVEQGETDRVDVVRRSAEARARAEQHMVDVAVAALGQMVAKTVTVTQEINQHAGRRIAGTDELVRLEQKVQEILDEQAQAQAELGDGNRDNLATIRQTAGEVAAIATGLIGAGQATGVLSDKMAATLTQVINIGEQVVGIVAQLDAGGSLNFASLVGVVGGLASVINSLFGDSAIARAREKLLRDNTDALDELRRVQGDILRISQPGAKLSAAEQAITEVLRAFDVHPARRHFSDTAAPSESGLRQALFRHGLSLADLEEIAQALGITLRNPESGKFSVDAFRQLLTALQTIDVNFADTFEGLRQQIQTFLKAGLLDPSQEFAALLQAATGAAGSPAITRALEGVDVFADREGAITALQQLIKDFAAGTLDKGTLGGLTGTQFLDVLTELIAFLRSEDALTPLAVGALGGGAGAGGLPPATAAFYTDALALDRDALTVTEQQLQRLAAIESLLASIAATPPAAPPSLGDLAPATTTGGVTFSGPLSITVQVAAGTAAEAQGRAAAQGFYDYFLDVGLGDAFRLERLLQGDVAQ